MISALSLLLATFVPAAHAGCETHVAKIPTLAPAAVGPSFSELVKCDKKMAESAFPRYLERAASAPAPEPQVDENGEELPPTGPTAVDYVTDLFIRAVDGDLWNPAWNAIGKITSYEMRDIVAARVGASCTAKPKVVSFLQGAYFGLRDIEFQQWDDGFVSCDDPKLWEWVEGQVKNPPPKQFDDKYVALLAIWVRRTRADGIPALQAGAAKAATNDGPFAAMLTKMAEAVEPRLGEESDPAAKQRLVDAMVAVAQGVPPDKARGVAQELANSGAEGPAARLLPTLYPDRVQAGGSFLYGAAVVEAGTCGGKKTAFIHYTTVSEPGKRWSILGDLESPMRAMKPKLKDCQMEEPWPVVHTPEPIKGAADADKWAAEREAEWAARGYDAKLQKEKPVTLP